MPATLPMRFPGWFPIAFPRARVRRGKSGGVVGRASGPVDGHPDSGDALADLFGPGAANGRVMRAEATTTPSACSVAATACSGPDIPKPMITGLEVAALSRRASTEELAARLSRPRSPP